MVVDRYKPAFRRAAASRISSSVIPNSAGVWSNPVIRPHSGHRGTSNPRRSYPHLHRRTPRSRCLFRSPRRRHNRPAVTRATKAKTAIPSKYVTSVHMAVPLRTYEHPSEVPQFRHL